jgi:hypothetical protein
MWVRRGERFLTHQTSGAAAAAAVKPGHPLFWPFHRAPSNLHFTHLPT